MEEGRQLRDENDRVVRKGLTPEEFEAEEARDFELPAPTLLRHRLRYFIAVHVPWTESAAKPGALDTKGKSSFVPTLAFWRIR
jgi:hypothetical protein